MPVYTADSRSPMLYDSITGKPIGYTGNDGKQYDLTGVLLGNSTNVPLMSLDPTAGLLLGGAAPTVEQQAAVRAGIGGSTAAVSSSQTQRLLHKLRYETGDAKILIIGDSTGNGADEWVYLLAQWLASEFPAFSVSYRLWDTTDYAAAVAIQTGTGAKTLTIYNASVSSTRPDYFLGERYTNVSVAIGAVDLFICNHGQNISGAANQDHESALFLELTETILVDHQDAGVLMISQNPRRDDTSSDRRSLAVRDVCALRQFGLVDVWSRFIDAGKAASLYADNIHPSVGAGTSESPTGTGIYLEALFEHFKGAECAPAANISLLSQSFGPNLLANGSFATYTTTPGAPDSWAVTNATASKDTDFKFGTNQYSVKIVGSGVGQPFLSQSLTANQRLAYRGQRLFLAVAVYTPSTENSTAGRIALVGSTNTANNYLTQGDGHNRFRWKFIPLSSSASDSYISVYLYANTASGSTSTVYYGAAILRAARLPSAASA